MIPILSADQIRKADAYTIQNEPITSIELMERASAAFVEKFVSLVVPRSKVVVISGVGNNGGDGLAIARMLLARDFRVSAYYVGKLENATEDFRINFERLGEHLEIQHIADEKHPMPKITAKHIVIDALFGSGLTRPVEGIYADVIESINDSSAEVFSVDIPSGLFTNESSGSGAVVEAHHTISFQTPKLVFFQPALNQYVGLWHIVDIGLDKGFIQREKTNYFITEAEDLEMPTRSLFDHKGAAGRILLVSGSKGRMGATTLSARAIMRSGCGLLFVHTPCCGLDILQINVPEAMINVDEHTEVISEVKPDENINHLVVGPGIGTSQLTQKAVSDLILAADKPLVLDADAINILAQNRHLLEALPSGSILTPHPGEFERLVGEWKNDFEKLSMLQEFCMKQKVNVVLKGAYSVVCDSFGKIFFNPTGNPGMATAGSGDVLTGIVGAFLGQGLIPFQALRSAVYVHGLAGDLAAKKVGIVSLVASDIVEHISEAIKALDR